MFPMCLFDLLNKHSLQSDCPALKTTRKLPSGDRTEQKIKSTKRGKRNKEACLDGVRGALLFGDDERGDLEAPVLLIQHARQNAAALNTPPCVRRRVPAQAPFLLRSRA